MKWNTEKQTIDQEDQMWFEVLISKHLLLTTIGDSRRLQENTERHVWVTLFANTNTLWSLQHSRVLWWHDTHTSSSCFTASLSHTHLLTHSEIMRCIRHIPDHAHCDTSVPPSLISLGMSWFSKRLSKRLKLSLYYKYWVIEFLHK